MACVAIWDGYKWTADFYAISYFCQERSKEMIPSNGNNSNMFRLLKTMIIHT